MIDEMLRDVLHAIYTLGSVRKKLKSDMKSREIFGSVKKWINILRPKLKIIRPKKLFIAKRSISNRGWDWGNMLWYLQCYYTKLKAGRRDTVLERELRRPSRCLRKSHSQRLNYKFFSTECRKKRSYRFTNVS